MRRSWEARADWKRATEWVDVARAIKKLRGEQLCGPTTAIADTGDLGQRDVYLVTTGALPARCKRWRPKPYPASAVSFILGGRSAVRRVSAPSTAPPPCSTSPC